MSSPGDNEHSRASVTPAAGAADDGPAEQLEWQHELDSAMSDLDTRLRHPRRRAGDLADQPTLPQLGRIDVTNELLDEIAWRVAEQIRHVQGAVPAAQPHGAAEAPKPRPAMPAGAALVIRVRWPMFSWAFWRRRSRRSQLVTSPVSS